MANRVLVTGGAGFIGSTLIKFLIRKIGAITLNIDKLTYAGTLSSLAEVTDDQHYHFIKADIADGAAVRAAFREFQPDLVFHLAAETHVDRSIDEPLRFVQTNVVGTAVLLQEAYNYWHRLPAIRQKAFRFHHVSTDEVFGSLPAPVRAGEASRYDPNSPYSASKAAADHAVRAWHRTYGLPVVLSNCGNNYGPYQFPEKFIPMMILKGLAGEVLPVYGNGEQVRDWLYVEDHARALWTIATTGVLGETYLVGDGVETRNIDVARSICSILDELAPISGGSRERLISFVTDRPAHDVRYALNCDRLRSELDWRPNVPLEIGLRHTVAWYLDRRDWWEPLITHVYGGERLGRVFANSGS